MPHSASRGVAMPLLLGALAGFGLCASLNHALVLGLIAAGAVSPEVALFGGRPPGIGTDQAATMLFLAGLIGALLAFPVDRAKPLLAALPLLLLAVAGPALSLYVAALAAGRTPAVGPVHLLVLGLWGAGVGAAVVLAARAVRARWGSHAGG